MPKHYLHFAMGIVPGLRHRKRHMTHFFNTSSPVRKLVVSGKGAMVNDDAVARMKEPIMETKPYRPKMTPMKFNF